MSNHVRVGIVGSGAWGTALAVLATRAGSDVALWSRNANVVADIRERRLNDIYLPGVFLDPNIAVTDDLSQTCRSSVVVLAVPSQNFRSACISLSDLLEVGVPVVIATKGIERGSLALMSEVAAAILPRNPLAVLSGPNFADEAARGLPTAATVACTDAAAGDLVVYALGGRLFRPYLTDDLIGAQIGGAVKNVIAIASGIAMGRQLGENARAALITRGFAELCRLCLAKGGRFETLAGLSGIGDLVLTCSSLKSRNFSLGVSIGQGIPVEELLTGQRVGLTEGAYAAESVAKLARKLGLEMPICQAVHAVLYENQPLDEAVLSLLDRPFGLELPRAVNG